MIEGSVSEPLANGSGSGKPGSGTLGDSLIEFFIFLKLFFTVILISELSDNSCTSEVPRYR
jgi:hypothetical protein